MNREFVIPEYVLPQDIKNARKMMGLTQEEFARLIGCSKPTIARMENGNDKITGPIVSAIYFINHSELSSKLIIPDMKYPLRIIYMYKQRICTIIDVDETNEKVEIINYESNIMFQAFGVNKHPTYKDYEDFLEERCFPRTRDKLKLMLEDLQLPFYDPLMIIEKTEGRMAEDDFWIKVVRNL